MSVSNVTGVRTRSDDGEPDRNEPDATMRAGTEKRKPALVQECGHRGITLPSTVAGAVLPAISVRWRPAPPEPVRRPAGTRPAAHPAVRPAVLPTEQVKMLP